MQVRTWGKGHMHPLLLEVQTCTAIMEIGVLVPRKLRVDLAQNPAIPPLGNIPKGFFILL